MVVNRANSSTSRTGSSRAGSSSRGGANSRASSGTSGGLSVWDLAVMEAKKKRQEPSGPEMDKAPREATLLFLGTRSAGKTTLLQRFLDRDEAPRHTLALEYTYGRKSGRTLIKDVCHLWELGGGSGPPSAPLLATPLTPRSLPGLAVVLVLDLSRPHSLWQDLISLLRAAKSEVAKAAEAAPGLRETLEAAATKRMETAGQEEGEIEPFMVPLVIIGGKYDIFQDLEPEGKKLICRALRYVAYTNGASLQFFSAKDAGLIKKAKELLSHYAFGTTESRSLAQDYNKPLIIPAGSDSLSAISPGETHDLNAWARTYTTRFPPEEGDEGANVVPEDPARDPTYAEPDIDNLRTQKNEELERIRREVGKNSSGWEGIELA